MYCEFQKLRFKTFADNITVEHIIDEKYDITFHQTSNHCEILSSFRQSWSDSYSDISCPLLFRSPPRTFAHSLPTSQVASYIRKISAYEIKLTLKAPITTIVVCFVFCRLLKNSSLQTVWTQIRLLLQKQADLGPHCLPMQNVSLKSLQEDAADNIRRRHFQMQIFLEL